MVFNWNRESRSLEVGAEWLPDRFQCRAAVSAVVAFCDPAVMPSEILFAPQPPRSRSRERQFGGEIPSRRRDEAPAPFDRCRPPLRDRRAGHE